MTNWEKYFGSPEKAALTLCDIESEYQYAIRSGIRNNVEPKDEVGEELSFDEIIEEAIVQAVHPLLVIFDLMGQSYVICGKEEKKQLTLVPTTAHEFNDWLNKEAE